MTRADRTPRVDWKKLPRRIALSLLGIWLCWYTLFEGGAVVPELLSIAFFAMAVVPLFFIYADWINGGPEKPTPTDDVPAEPSPDT